MKKIFSLLLTLTMVLSLAACGGNSSTPSTPSEDGTQSDAANYDTIKIGYVSDLTGATALWGTAGQYGAELAIKQLGKLRGCEAHSTVILAQVDDNVFRNLGVNLTCEPNYQTKKLFHK